MSLEKMTEVKDTTKKNKKNFRNNLAMQVLFFVVAMFVIVMLYRASIIAINNTKYIESVEERRKTNNLEVICEQGIVYEIEELQLNSESVMISGWIAWNEEIWDSTSIVLQATDSSEVIVVEAVQKERKDVSEYFEKYGEIKSIGFTATFESSKIKENICYEVLIDVSYKSKDENGLVIHPGVKITTHRYLYNGIEYAYNPLEFVEPDIDMEEWQNIFANGRLCNYSMEYGTWIYLYERMLYIVIDSNKIPSLEKVPSVPIEMYTNREDLVPEKQMERYTKRGHTYAEIYLKEHHYLDKENSDYFVVTYKLPVEYPILYIQTGPYGNRDDVKWVYRGNFRVHTLEEMKQWN